MASTDTFRRIHEAALASGHRHQEALHGRDRSLASLTDARRVKRAREQALREIDNKIRLDGRLDGKNAEDRQAQLETFRMEIPSTKQLLADLEEAIYEEDSTAAATSQSEFALKYELQRLAYLTEVLRYINNPTEKQTWQEPTPAPERPQRRQNQPSRSQPRP